jgi:predicted dehydrogenase
MNDPSCDLSNRLAVGLIGLGRHGQRYARHLVADIPEARWVAACRRNSTLGLGLDTPEPVTLYDDYRRLIADPKVQAIIVATPPSLHPEICMTAIAAGKPLLVEKPLATLGRDAAEIVRATEAAGVPLMTAQTLRYEAVVQALKPRLPSVGELQSLSLVTRVEARQAERRDPRDFGGRGVLLEVGIHLLDAIRFLTGDEAVSVRATMRTTHSSTVDIWLAAELTLSKGQTCLLEVSRLSAGRVGRIEWIGDRGQLQADWIRHRLTYLESTSQSTDWSIEPRPTLVDTARAFLQALIEGRPVPISGRDGYRAVAIADACYESAEAQGRPTPVRNQLD